MKLLMTADAVGGVWTYALTLSAQLAARGVRVVLATMGPRPTAAQRDRASQIRNLKLICSGYSLEWMADPWEEVDCAGQWLLDLAARESVDLVHLNGYAHGALPWHRPVVVVAHSCVYSWWLAVHGCTPPPQWTTYRQRVVAGLANAQCIVAPTRAFLRTIQTLYEPAAPVRVIYNGRSASAGDDGLSERLPIVFACGRIWDEAKNMQVLNQVAQTLPWHVYAAGGIAAPDGRCVSMPALHCLGDIPAQSVQLWLQRAAIFVHPARYEPFGLAVLEAALAGCVLVLADLPALRELWDGAAVFVDVGAGQSLEHALLELIENPSRRRDLSASALERAREFRVDTMADVYYNLYGELLQQASLRERVVA